jgi:hypothetical protein
MDLCKLEVEKLERKEKKKMNNAMLKALGIEILPPGISEYELTARIMRNPEVSRLAHELVTRHYALVAVQNMSEPQKAKLAQEIGATKPPAEKVQWGIGQMPTTGQWFIKAATHNQESYFSGKPENAYKFTLGGETCPPDLVAQYRQVYVWVSGGNDDVVLGKANQQPPQEHAPIQR